MYFDPVHPCPSQISSQPIKPPSNFVSFLSVPLFVKLGRENKTWFSPGWRPPSGLGLWVLRKSLWLFMIHMY